MSFTKDKVERKPMVWIMKSENKTNLPTAKVETKVVDYVSHEYKAGAYSNKQFFDDIVKLEKGSGENKDRVVRPFKGLMIPGTNKNWSFTQVQIIHKPYKEAYRRMYNAGLGPACKMAQAYYRGNNTVKALSNRMCSQLTLPHKLLNTPGRGLISLRFRCDLSKYSFQNFSATHECFDNMNIKADAGLPYSMDCGVYYKNSNPKVTDMTTLGPYYLDKSNARVGTPVKIMQHAFEWAKFLHKEILDKVDLIEDVKARFTKVFEKNPELNTFIIKRKDEKQEYTDYNVKVRPYGVQPLPMRLLCKWAMHPLETTLVPFWVDPKSISAYGFSHFYGGAERIKSFINFHYYKNMGAIHFAPLCYGDDQLWFFFGPMDKNGERKIAIVNPDIKAMDMNTSTELGSHFVHWGKQYFGQQEAQYFNGFYMAVCVAFNKYAHLGAGYIINLLSGLLSGVSGTTLKNIHSSAVIAACIDVLMYEFMTVNCNDIDAILMAIPARIKRNLGFEFKNLVDDKFTVIKFDNLKQLHRVGISIPFLGQIFGPIVESEDLKPLEGVWVSMPENMHKFGCSLILPGNHAKPQMYYSERVLGVYLSGAYLDSDWSKFLHEEYRVACSSEMPSKITCSEVEFEVKECEAISKKLDEAISDGRLKRGMLPSRQYVYDMYAMTESEFNKKWKSAQVWNEYFIKDVYVQNSNLVPLGKKKVAEVTDLDYDDDPCNNNNFSSSSSSSGSKDNNMDVEDAVLAYLKKNDTKSNTNDNSIMDTVMNLNPVNTFNTNQAGMGNAKSIEQRLACRKVKSFQESLYTTYRKSMKKWGYEIRLDEDFTDEDAAEYYAMLSINQDLDEEEQQLRQKLAEIEWEMQEDDEIYDEVDASIAQREFMEEQGLDKMINDNSLDFNG
jgi:hypothetical protein